MYTIGFIVFFCVDLCHSSSFPGAIGGILPLALGPRNQLPIGSTAMAGTPPPPAAGQRAPQMVAPTAGGTSEFGGLIGSSGWRNAVEDLAEHI
jgi:hypothetical protein